MDEFLALLDRRNEPDDGVGLASASGEEIDEILQLQAAQGDADSLTEVCRRVKECIYRCAPEASVYRMLIAGPVVGENAKVREDVRLKHILRALRDEQLDNRPAGSGEAAETEWLARAATSHSGQFESQAALLSLIDRGFALGREARVIVLVARASSVDKWHGVFGRIDLVRPGDPPPNEVRPRGNVRVIDERPERDVLLTRLAAALRGEEFVVGDVALGDHGMDSHWSAYRHPDNGIDYGTRWPNVMLSAREFKNRPFMHGPFQADGPAPVIPTLRDLAWAVSGFLPGPGNDVRPQRLQVLLWDYRGRIDQFRPVGKKLYVSVHPPGDPRLSLVATVEGVNGHGMPFVKEAPAEEVLALAEEITWRRSFQSAGSQSSRARGSAGSEIPFLGRSGVPIVAVSTTPLIA